MRKFIILFCLFAIVSACAFGQYAIAENEKASISGEAGFTVATGELFTAVENLLSSKESDFYIGKDVSFDRYMPFYPEILEISYHSFGDANVHVTPLIKYSPNDVRNNILPEEDSDPFSLVQVSGIDQYSGFDMGEAVEKVSAAIIYLTNKKITNYKDAVDFFRAIKVMNGAYAQDGPFRYSYAKQFLGNHGGHDFYSFEFLVEEAK